MIINFVEAGGLCLPDWEWEANLLECYKRKKDVTVSSYTAILVARYMIKMKKIKAKDITISVNGTQISEYIESTGGFNIVAWPTEICLEDEIYNSLIHLTDYDIKEKFEKEKEMRFRND